MIVLCFRSARERKGPEEKEEEEGFVVERRKGIGVGRSDFSERGRAEREEGREEGEGKQRREKRGVVWVNWRGVVGKRVEVGEAYGKERNLSVES